MINLSINYAKETSIINIRDIGDISTDHGHFKKNIFFRSGELYDLSSQDISFLENKLKIKKIYDFRRPEEIENRPDSQIKNAEYKNINLMSTAGQANPSLKNMTISDDIESHMFDAYTELVLGDSAQKGYHTFFMALLSASDPILFHCFAGKDRTGFAAALILKIAGVSDEEIYKDYLQTNIDRQVANKKILQAFKNKLSPDKLAGLEVSLNVKKEYLDHAFSLINQHFENFENYLSVGLDLPTNYISTFRNLYVV